MASVDDLKVLPEEELNQLAEEKGLNPEDYDSTDELAEAVASQVTPEDVAGSGGDTATTDESEKA